MNRFVVMVDAGYLLHQATQILSRKASKKRADLEIVDPPGLIKLLLAKANELLSLRDKELLRVYWYDGVMSSGLTGQQRSIVEVDDVQFRAGTVNGIGQQKGVDSLIVTDLIELTSHHAICDAILVTGDSDLAVGIELSQRRGVRLAVLGLEDMSVGVANGQSFEITSRADRVGCLGAADIAGLMRYNPPPATVVPLRAKEASVLPVPVEAVVVEKVAVAVLMQAPQVMAAEAQVQVVEKPAHKALPEDRELTAADQSAISDLVNDFLKAHPDSRKLVDPVTKRIEASIDRDLIFYAFDHLKRGRLTDAERAYIRKTFRMRA